MTVAATQSGSSESKNGAGGDGRVRKAGGVGTFEKKELSIYGERPWGFTLNGGCHYFPSLIVTKVSGEGKAAKFGLEEGDLIEAVNGQQCRVRTEAVKLIQQSTNVLHLTLIRFPNRDQLVDTCLENEQQSAINKNNLNDNRDALSSSTNSTNLRSNFKLSHAGNSTGYYVNQRTVLTNSTLSASNTRLTKSVGDLQAFEQQETRGDSFSAGKENYLNHHHNNHQSKQEEEENRTTFLVDTSLSSQKSVEVEMGQNAVSIAPPDDISHSTNHKQSTHSISDVTNAVPAAGIGEKKTSNGELYTITGSSTSGGGGGDCGKYYHTRSQSVFDSRPNINGASDYVDSYKRASTLRDRYDESDQCSQNENDDEFGVAAFSVYPRRHSLGYSLEIVTQKEGSSDVLPKCTVFDSNSPHQISVPENFLKRRSVIVKSDTPSALFREAQRARRRLEKSRSYEAFSQFEAEQNILANDLFVSNNNNNTAFNKHGATQNIHQNISIEQQNASSKKSAQDERDSKPQSHAPLPPTRRSSMNIVAEMAHKGVWSRSTNAVAKVPQRKSNLQDLNQAKTSETKSHRPIFFIKQKQARQKVIDQYFSSSKNKRDKKSSTNIFPTLKEKETSDDISLRLRIDNNSKVMQETSASWFQSDFDDSIKEAVLNRDHKLISSKGANANKPYPDIATSTLEKNKASLVQLPHDTIPPPIPARESSKSINFANYTNANIAPLNVSTSFQVSTSQASNSKTTVSHAPVPVARQRIIVDPLTLAKTPVPDMKTSKVVNSTKAPKHSTYSPFHKPLPSLPQEVSYNRRGSESALHFARRSTEAEFVDIREPSPDPPSSVIDKAVTPGQTKESSSQFMNHSRSISNCQDTLPESTSYNVNWSQSDDRSDFSSDVTDSHFHSGTWKGVLKPFLSSTPLPNQMDCQNGSFHNRTNLANRTGVTHHFSSNRRNYFSSRTTDSTSGARPPLDPNSGTKIYKETQSRFLSDPSKMKEATEEAIKVRYTNKSDPQTKTVEKVVSGRQSHPNDSLINNQSVISDIAKPFQDFTVESSLEELCSATAREQQLAQPDDFNAKLRRSLAEPSSSENKKQSHESSTDSPSQQQDEKGVESIREKTDSFVDQTYLHFDDQLDLQLGQETRVNCEMSLASLDPIANSRFGEIRSDHRILVPSKRSGTLHSFTSTHVKQSSNDSGNGKDASNSALQLDLIEDDADEHLAGSSQSQFQIAKNRFLRKQNDSIRSSQTHMSRSSFVSRRDNSLRSRIAKSTENVIRCEKPTTDHSTTLKESCQRPLMATESESNNGVKENYALRSATSAINRTLSQSAANLSEITGMSDLTVDSGVGGMNSFAVTSSNGSGAIVSRGSVADDVTTTIIPKGSVTDLRGSKASIVSNSRTMSSDDLSLSVGGGGSAGGFLSRGASFDNLLTEADHEQVQSALSRVSDLLARDRMELANLSGTLLDQSHSECQQIVTALQKSGRESDVKRFHRYLESLCTSCKLAVHEENRLSKLDQRISDLSRKNSEVSSPAEGEATGEHDSQNVTPDNSPLQPQQPNITLSNTRSHKSMQKELEHLRKSMEKQKEKVSEAQMAFEDAETTLVQHLERALKNCTEEEVQSSKHKIENRKALTRKICLCETSIKANQDMEKYLNKQLLIPSSFNNPSQHT